MRYKGIICLILGIGGSIVSCNDDGMNITAGTEASQR